MNIQERRNGKGDITSYRIRVFDHRDSNGKQVFKTLSVKYNPEKSAAWNRKNAEKEGGVFEKQVEQQIAADARVTFNDYADYFLEVKAQSGIATSTVTRYRNNQKKLAPYIGHIQLKSLTPTALNKVYGAMLGDGISNNYVHSLHIFIHNVLQTAFREGVIPSNYANAAMPPKLEKRDIGAIGEKDSEKFFAALYAEKDYYVQQVFFSVLLAAGCRIGELCALSWDNVDFDEGRIHICRHFVYDSDGYHISDGCKTTAGERWLYMDENTMDTLREFYLKTATKYGSKWNYSANAVFFSTSKFGYHITPKSMRVWFKRFLKRNNLPDYHPHNFRHTAISLQLQAGVSVPYVAKRAGHSNGNVTLAVYAHTLRNNDKHLCEIVTKAIPKMSRAGSVANNAAG